MVSFLQNLSLFHAKILFQFRRPEKLEATASAIAAIANTEIPERDERGKLVVLIEAEGEAALMSCISEIESTPGVISANLVYHQIDD